VQGIGAHQGTPHNSIGFNLKLLHPQGQPSQPNAPKIHKDRKHTLTLKNKINRKTALWNLQKKQHTS
jgi:hypothetical protein